MNHQPPSSNTTITTPQVVGHASLDGLPEILRNKILMEYIGGIRDRGNVASYFDPSGIGIDGEDTDVSESSSVIGSGNHVTKTGDEKCGDSAGGAVQGGDVEMQSEGEEEEENDCESVESGESLLANSHYNAFINEMPTLMRLASTSKSWSRWIYRDMCTPDLWRDINADDLFRSAKDEMTDAWLGNFLRWINAREVVQTLNLSGCDNIMGPGLEPIRGSTILREFRLDWTNNLRGMHSDGKILVSIAESLVPDEPPSVATIGTGQQALLLLTLPHSRNFQSDSDTSKPSAKGKGDNIAPPPKKKAKKSTKSTWRYQASLKTLQQRYRKYYHRVKSSLLCPDCGKSQIVWFHSNQFEHMEIKTLCVQCERIRRNKEYDELEAKREAMWEAMEDDDDLECESIESLDIGILGKLGIEDCCSNCKNDGDDCLNGNSLVCSVCELDLDSNDYSPATFYCSAETEHSMHFCSKCKIPCCKYCMSYRYKYSLGDFAIQTCKSELIFLFTFFFASFAIKYFYILTCIYCHFTRYLQCLECGVEACGICRGHRQCGSQACSYYDRPFYCSDCDVVKKCARCKKFRCCERDGKGKCSISCAPCTDTFCLDDGFEPCKLSADFCRTCKNWFCLKKDECPDITRCRSCYSSACSKCIASGDAKHVYTKCDRCEDYHCGEPKCLNYHETCEKIDHDAERKQEEFHLALYAGRLFE